MNKDVLGKNELESLKLNWAFSGPSLMSGRCAATGTCDNKPVSGQKKMDLKKERIVYFSADLKSAKAIMLQYGKLRSN